MKFIQKEKLFQLLHACSRDFSTLPHNEHFLHLMKQLHSFQLKYKIKKVLQHFQALISEPQNSSLSLQQFSQDVSYEGGTRPIQIQLASLSSLAFILFHEGLGDFWFFKTLSILLVQSENNFNSFLPVLQKEFLFSQSELEIKELRIGIFFQEFSEWFPDIFFEYNFSEFSPCTLR